jgi:predicted dehydrogenase
MNDETNNPGTANPNPSDATSSAGGSGAGWDTVTRRGLLKALVSIPFFGAFFFAFFKKKAADDMKKQAILAELGVSESAPAVIPEMISSPPSERIRLGLIGNGFEGSSLIRYAGFAHPDWIEEARQAARENPGNRQFETFMNQDDLNVALTGVCDVYDVRAEAAIAASAVELRPGGASANPPAQRFLRYTDMYESGEIDAVIIASPDHWHSQMTVDAANAGIHVYCEKCMSRTEEDANAMYKAVKDTGIVFQLGHQNRQSESHIKAREIVGADILGPVTLIETTTNRNSPWGAWVWEIEEEGSPQTIDWEQFEGPAPHKVPFNLERFFRWRCWYDYGTGLAGDLMSHEYDAVNQILEVGIPHSVVASGGIYYYKDGRDVPDVFQASCEYPDRDLTLVYSATLANGDNRGLTFMGHDASMEVGGSLTVTADGESTRYEEKIDDGIIDPSRPMFTYRPGFKGIDAVTSATEQYFASRGLLFTYRGGRPVSAYHLHIGEWLNVIRNGGQTSCNIDRGFEEAMTCHMATRSYREGRKVTWDPVNRRIV